MSPEIHELVWKLEQEHSLIAAEYETLLKNRTPKLSAHLAKRARALCQKVYGKTVYIRGLIEITNLCRNNCLYCGIRKGNTSCDRYRLTKEEILECCREGYAFGFRTFVLQGGEDGYYTDQVLCEIVAAIKERYPDCAVTLSMGERGRGSYQRLFEAGADRYLLRHETANEAHYGKLHPEDMSYSHRMQCLYDLKEIGYQTGCGFMVGSPYQTMSNLAEDLKFIETFHPQMCGIGPFIPHKDTPFRKEPPGSAALTCDLLSIIRLIDPGILLPATTALGTVEADGRERGILAGANVVMPNLSPQSVRKKYTLYDNKLCTGAEAAQSLGILRKRMQSIGYEVVTDRGDSRSVW